MDAKKTLKYADEPGLDELVVVKKFNEWMSQVRDEAVPKMLFGSLWLEGEIAVMSANGGLGKSLLGVQIARSIAGGEKLAPFEMTAKPQKVLYLNLKLTPKQFAMRYAEEQRDEDGECIQNKHEFPADLHRVDVNIHGKLPEGYRSFDEVLAPLVERLVAKTRAKVVVIDSITYLQRSVYGYRETFAMMRGLHALKTRLGISILVLARTSKYGSVRESAAGSCSSLFSRFADSVFTIGQSRLEPSARYVKQLIAHSSEKIYDESHVASFRIKRLGANFLGFEHCGFGSESEHQQPVSERRLWPTIDKVKTLTDEGMSIREISVELALPKSSVHRYLQMWTAEIGAACRQPKAGPNPQDPTREPNYFPGREEYNAAIRHPKFGYLVEMNVRRDDTYRQLMREYHLIEAARRRAFETFAATGIAPKLSEDPEYAAFMGNGGAVVPSDAVRGSAGEDLAGGTGDEDKSVHAPEEKLPDGVPPGVRHTLNAYGRDIWIEIEGENGGKPVKWHSLDSNGRVQTHVRDANGVGITRDKVISVVFE